eukprot:UN14391
MREVRLSAICIWLHCYIRKVFRFLNNFLRGSLFGELCEHNFYRGMKLLLHTYNMIIGCVKIFYD